MNAGWQTRPLAALVENLDGRRVPVKEINRKPGPFPYYGASGIVDYVDGFLFEGLHVLVAEDGENLRTRKLPVAFLADGKFWVNNHAHVVRGNDQADTRFLCYALQQADISGFLSGSTMPKLTQGNLLRIPVLTPPLPEQRAIAATLGALDDKIELNRKMNATLEVMARALFRDWFVDFGPTRARMEGREPYLSSDLWSIFPDRLDDEGRPEGWEVGTLRDVVTFNPKEALKKGTKTPYLDMAALPTQGANHAEPIQRAFNSGSKFRDGDTLFARITPCLENGKTCLVHGLGDEIVGWGSTEFIVLRPQPPLPAAFGYLVARASDFRNVAIQSMTGTSGRQRAMVDALANYPLAIPPVVLMQAFNRSVSPLFDRIARNELESRTLAQTRDLLLPCLMSGELRLAEAEQIASEVA